MDINYVKLANQILSLHPDSTDTEHVVLKKLLREKGCPVEDIPEVINKALAEAKFQL